MRREPTLVSWIVLGILGSLLAGCGVFGAMLGGGSNTRPPDERGRTYAGPACDEVLLPLDQSKRVGMEASVPITTDPRLEVLLSICHRGERTNTTGHRVEQNPRVGRTHYLTRHEGFDDRHGSDLEAALLLASCEESDCHEFSGYNVEEGPDVVDRKDGEAGMLFSYAAMIDQAELEAALAGLELPADAQRLFIERVAAAKQRHASRVDAMPEPKRELVAGIPIDVRRERAAYFQAHAGLYAELDGLAETLAASRGSGSVDEADLAALRELRSRYAQQCETPECRFEPFYVEVTHELALAHLAAKSPLDLMVETRLLRDPRTLERNMAEAIHRAQTEAAHTAREALEALREANDRGLDEASTAALVGDAAPLYVDLHALWKPDVSVPSYEELVETKSVHPVQSYVAAVKAKGDRAEIRFKGSRYQTTEAYGCRRTKRIERIDADGRLHYETDCKYRKVTRKVPPKDSIVVPASEVAGVRAGELVDAFVVGPQREGRIVSVHAGQEELVLVQWLGDRFGG